MSFTKDQIDIVDRLAKAEGWETPALLAIVNVESNGNSGEVIAGKFEPIIRYEGHYFDKLCKPAIREAARKAGVSAKSAGVIKNPASQRSRWALLLKAAQFDALAAYSSCSYGVGQVMGSHWKVLGFPTVDALVAFAREGFENQVKLMIKFIKHFKLDDELAALDWSGFARGYNGPAFKGYDTRMAEAYAKFGGINQIATVRSGTLRLGSTGAGVRDIQSLLNVAGFRNTVDGDFGPGTKQAVIDFQKAHKLTADGIVGPQTQRALSDFRAISSEKPGQQKLLDIDLVKKGAAIAIAVPATLQSTKETLESAVVQLTPYSFLAPITKIFDSAIGVVTLSMIVVGIGVGIYGWWKSKKTDTGTKVDEEFTPVPEGYLEGPLVLPPTGT